MGMSYIIALALAVILAFSFKIVHLLVRILIGETLYQKIEHTVIYLWGFLIIVTAYSYEDNYVFRLPTQHEAIVTLIIVTAIMIIFTSRLSGYKPVGTKNILQFVIVFPIIEEVIFRGMILPILTNAFPFQTHLEIFQMPVTIPIILSAFLFAIAHLQYYKLNQTSIKFMLFAFMGGLIFGLLTDYSLSIVSALLLHIEFNLLAAYYSKKQVK